MIELIGKYTDGMKLADMHVHTIFSKDARNKGLNPEQAVEIALAIGLSAIAITDHHAIAGAQQAASYVDRNSLPLNLITGVEITTKATGAHILGLNVRHNIEEKETVFQAIEAILEQDGLVIIPHPFYRNLGGRQNGITQAELLDVMNSKLPIHGFEVYSQGVADAYNRRIQGRGGDNDGLSDANSEALKFYQVNSRLLGAPISSSDTHRYTLGRAQSAYNGDLITAIKNKTTIPLKLTPEEMVEIYLKGFNRLNNPYDNPPFI